MGWTLMACPYCGIPGKEMPQPPAASPGQFVPTCAHAVHVLRLTLETAQGLQADRRMESPRVYVAGCSGDPVE